MLPPSYLSPTTQLFEEKAEGAVIESPVLPAKGYSSGLSVGGNE